jgi:hypothetical protein
MEAGRREERAWTSPDKESVPHDHQLIYPPVQEFWAEAIKGSS